MRIGGVTGARDVTPRHWEKLASENNLDPERVVGQARRMAGLVLSNIEEAYSDVEPRIRDRILMLVDSANTKIDPTYDSASMTDDPTGMLSGLMPPADEGNASDIGADMRRHASLRMSAHTFFVYPILAVLSEYVATPFVPTIWFVGMVNLMSVRVVDSTALRISSCTSPPGCSGRVLVSCPIGRRP